MVIDRNTIVGSEIGFLVQGETSTVHLVLVPQFHNVRHHAVFSCLKGLNVRLSRQIIAFS